MQEFKKARTSLQHTKRLHRRAKTARINWENKQEKREYDRDRKMVRRIAQLPDNLKCSWCKRIVLSSRRWVVKDDFVGCRSCYVKMEKPAMQNVKRLKVAEQKYILPPGKLRAARHKCELSLLEFGKRCGWSAAYQSRLELREMLVSESTVNVIRSVLRNNAVNVDFLET